MAVCGKCNHENPEGTKFCENCGAELYEKIFCPSCGEETSSEFAFCQNCGAPVTEEALKPEANLESTETNASKKKSPKKWIAIGGIAAVAIIAVALIASLSGKGGGKSGNYTLYVKDKEIVYNNFSKSGPWQVSTRLVNSSDDVSKEEMSRSGSTLGEYTTLSKDGKTIFFPDRISSSDNGVSLYFRPVGDEKADPTKIDSGIVEYVLNSAASIVTYVKSESLYQYNVKTGDKDKIASDVDDFYVSDDGAKIVYLTDEGNIYFKEANKDKEKLESDIDWIEHVSDDCATIFYMKDDSFYKRPVNGEREKIASDVGEVLEVYDSGEAYYLKVETGENTLMNYVKDDMKSSDEQMEYPIEPDYPSYPSYWAYDTTEEYEAALAQYNTAIEQYQRDWDAYEEAWEAYYEKDNRDSLRESLENWTMSESNYSLFYYNGKESTLITDAFVENSESCAYKSPALIFRSYNQSSIDQVKLSEIVNLYDVEQMVRSALYSSSEVYICVKEASNIIDQEDATAFRIDSDGNTVLYLDDVDEASGDLYKIVIANGKPQKAELYDTDVWEYMITFVDDGKVTYFKDYNNNDGIGDLYLNKTRIDYDVRGYGTVRYNKDTDTLVYFTDWESDKWQGTLKTSKNGQSVKVNDDVHDFILTPSNDIVYLYDYSMKSYAGDLYIYKNSESEKVDTDVTAIIPIYSYKYRGSIYGW